VARYVIDVDTALMLVRDHIEVAEEHELLAPTLFRSQVLSRLHEEVVCGAIDAPTAGAELDAVRRLRPRLLGDAVLQRVAWQVADELGWASTYGAEYIALTKLQGDALVAGEAELAEAAAALVPTADIAALRAS
jgi:predicted nucleic acid-binding protein